MGNKWPEKLGKFNVLITRLDLPETLWFILKPLLQEPKENLQRQKGV